MPPTTIYVDARALQDSNYRARGVGQHATSLLRAIREHDWGNRRPRLVALTDIGLEPLQVSFRYLFDKIQQSGAKRNTRVKPDVGSEWYLSLSPMTHDPTWADEFLTDENLYKIALFYDMIPLEHPERYLADANARLDYCVALAWLGRFDTFAAISRASGDALAKATGIDEARIFVSGVAVRSTLEAAAALPRVPVGDRKWIVVAGGGDPRKNPECVIVAQAQSKILQEAGIGVSIFGNYPETMRAELRELHARSGGRSEQLRFHAHLTDDELTEVYRSGLLTIVSSKAEGFSIPIVESSALGTPVLASDVAAHSELIVDANARFPAEEPDVLRDMLERIVADDDHWAQLLSSQADVWKNYTPARVGERFVDGVTRLSIARTPAAPFVNAGVRPSIAILTPLPPAHSGVADYSAVTLRPLAAVADLHMFTPTPDAKAEAGWASLRPIASLRYTAARFDAVVSVIGNSSFHTEIYDYLMEHGGACIAHDARQIDFHLFRHGLSATTALASKELRRTVAEREVQEWAGDQRSLPTHFMLDLAEASDPLIVHSPTTGALLKSAYGCDPVYIPFAQYTNIPRSRLDVTSRGATRRRLGFEETDLVIATFGYVSADKAPTEVLWTGHFLKSWGHRVKIVFCGAADPASANVLKALAEELGLSDDVVGFKGQASPTDYVDYLVAADIGIQLRIYFMGGLSGALADCIGAALPTISNQHLAEAMEAPSFVRRVKDGPSAILIAEAALAILASGHHRLRPIAEADAYVRRRSPAEYSRNLAKALQLDVHWDESSR